MTPSDFRRIALSFEGAEEGSHMGAMDFRVGGRIFATLASVKEGYGNLMITPELQAEFIAERPELFLPIHGGWGRMGMTHIRLAVADEDSLRGALHTAWRLRVEKNAKTGKKPASVAKTRIPAPKKTGKREKFKRT
ncbi:MAG: MmcQ/YjbR family DNA-binding protein [Terracidiphilus sp.]|jgi:hypothetical protein